MTATWEFPEVIDNSARSAFVKCPTSWMYGYGRMLASPVTNIHLHAGGAFAYGLETARKSFFDKGLPVEQSIGLGAEALIKYYGSYEPDPDAAKTCERMVGALFEYFIEYPMDENPVRPLQIGPSKHAIEFRFGVPLPIKHPVTGNPLLYGGRFDMLGVYNDTLFAVDEKTASQLGAQWSNNWELDSQFTGYCWAAQQFGYPVAGAIIRGVSILKERYGHAQAIVYRPEWQITRWLEELLDNVSDMIRFWERNRYPLALDKAACNSYGGCGFKSLCLSPTPEVWVASSFVRREWNPLHESEPGK